MKLKFENKEELQKEIKDIITEDKKWISNNTLEACNILRLNGFIRNNDPDYPIYPY